METLRRLVGILLIIGAFFGALMFAPTPTDTHESPVAYEQKSTGGTLLFVGDIMLDRNVRLLSEMHGYDYPFRSIANWLHEFDAVVGNLEGPIVPGTPRAQASVMRFAFTENTPSLLKENNISIVSIANNHTHDYGTEGYALTRGLLEKSVIAVGHPLTARFDTDGQYLVGDVSLQFLAFNATYPSFSIEDAQEALRIDSQSDWTIVLIHWGDEYSLISNTEQQEIARLLIDAGAEVIIGAHPHVTQEVERYRNGIIFYSLGNFIFDQYFSKDVEEGLAVGARIEKDEITFTLFPIHGNHSQPKQFSDSERAAWLQTYALRSTSLESEIKSGTIVTRK